MAALNASGACSGAKWLTSGRMISFGAGDGARQVLGVLAQDELLVRAIDDRDLRPRIAASSAGV